MKPLISNPWQNAGVGAIRFGLAIALVVTVVGWTGEAAANSSEDSDDRQSSEQFRQKADADGVRVAGPDGEPSRKLDGDELRELCERFPCRENPPAFSPATLARQFGWGGLATGAALATSHGLIRWTADDSIDFFHLIVGGLPLSVASWVPSIIGERHGGYRNRVGSVAGNLVGFAGGALISRSLYRGRDITDVALLLRATALTTATVFVGSVLGYHVEELWQQQIGDRPPLRLVGGQMTPTVVATQKNTAVLLQWRSEF